MKIPSTKNFHVKLFTLFSALAFLIFCVLACSKGERKPDEIQKRGDLTIEFYGARQGITHGDGSLATCSFIFKGQRYFSPPMIKDSGRIFRCDAKPNSDEPVVWIAFYRPENDWTCRTRFGKTDAKCLPDTTKPVGGLLTVKNNELALEELGFWDASFDWTDTSLKFKDGREFNYKTWTWSGCGDTPLKYVKSGALTLAKGTFCNSNDWYRVYFNDNEVLPADAQNHPYKSAQISQNKDLPGVITWMGSIQMVIYLSNGKPLIKEMPNGGEFLADGTFVQWWSEDYQTRFSMNLRTEETYSETRTEVQEKSEKETTQRDLIKQNKPILRADSYGKIEVDYKDKHNSFYINDLYKFTDFKLEGAFPHRVTSLMSAAKNGDVYFLFLLRNVYETADKKDVCGGDLPLNLVWVQTDDKLLPKAAKAVTISSCRLMRKAAKAAELDGDKMKAVFEEKGKRYELNYDNQIPENSFSVKEF